MKFGLRTHEDDAIAIIHHALNSGINFIDTANIYGTWQFQFGEGSGRQRRNCW